LQSPNILFFDSPVFYFHHIKFFIGSVAELASERNFQISSEKNEKGESILKLSLPPTDEFFAAEIWKLQLKLIRQQTLIASFYQKKRLFKSDYLIFATNYQPVGTKLRGN